MNKSSTEAQKDYLCLALIIGIVFIRFFRTIVFAKPLSKLFLLAHWDTVFYSLRAGHSINMDPAFVQLFMPYRFFVAHYWHKAFPLWNQLSGLGMPLLADPQALVFSPFNALLVLLPNISTWNILIILQLLVGATSTYWLCREFELNCIGALIAALLFTFCPWAQWNVEIYERGVCLTPFVLLFFARLGKRNSIWSAALAGVAAAIDIVSSHPEVAFLTIIFATALAYLVSYYNDQSKFSFIRFSSKILLTAIIAFGLSAPMLLPFVEYLVHGDTYKFNHSAAGGFPLEVLIAHYLYPFYEKGSLFFGPLSLYGLVTLFCFPNKSNRFVQPLIFSFILSILAVTRLFPLNFLFSIPPFSLIYATYCMPLYALFLSILSGLGISYLVSGEILKESKKLRLLCIAVVALSTVPLLFYPWHHQDLNIHFDKLLDLPQFDFKQWFTLLSYTLFMLIILVVINIESRWKKFGYTFFIAVGIICLLYFSFKSLPIEPNFKYPRSLPAAIKAKDNTRFLSIGDHLFRPNTNLIYGIPMLSTMNPLMPKGYLEFIEAAGAKIGTFTTAFPVTISRLLDLVNVDTIVSEQPIIDQSIISDTEVGSVQAVYSDLLRLSNIRLFYDPEARSLFCSLIATPTRINNGYHLCFIVSDINNNPISYTEAQPIAGTLEEQHIVCSGFLPPGINYWQASIRILSDKDWLEIPPSEIKFGKILPNCSWFIADSNQPNSITKFDNNRFQLVRKKDSILVYKNKTALNRYFFAKEVHWVKENRDALSYLKDHQTILHDTAVLEEKEKNEFNNLAKTEIFDQSGTVEKITDTDDHSHFSLFPSYTLKINTSTTAFLIISDLYYPGWKAYLDEKQCRIFKTDYLLRGVVIPPGIHYLKFVYEPISFCIGILLFLVTTGSLVILGVMASVNSRKNNYQN